MMTLEVPGALKEVRNAWEAVGTSQYAKILLFDASANHRDFDQVVLSRY
jgi:hypothetical protein